MKSFRALLLILALSVCTFAGDMPNGKDGNQGSGGQAGDMPCGKVGEIPDDLVTVTILQLLQSVLPLL